MREICENAQAHVAAGSVLSAEPPTAGTQSGVPASLTHRHLKRKHQQGQMFSRHISALKSLI